VLLPFTSPSARTVKDVIIVIVIVITIGITKERLHDIECNNAFSADVRDAN
jgi:uncharacterized membrane protein YhaH (DUF805 family)